MRSIFLLFVVLFSCLMNRVKAQVDVGDSLALVDLYNSTNGAGWYNHNNWLTKRPVSTWNGVTVKNKNVQVIGLSSNNLIGTLPESIGNFDSLKILSVSDNGLSGRIPSSIGNLKTLKDLLLNEDSLTGSIPSSIGNLTVLKHLSLYNNQLSGEIPASIGNCFLLEKIILSGNKITGNLPSSLKRLILLRELDLYGNRLSGELEDVFAKSCPLYSLALGSNKFSGIIPSFLERYNQMYYLDLSHNEFEGHIPLELARLTGLKYLYLFQNKLSGDVPKSLFNLQLLRDIEINGNQLSFEDNPTNSDLQFRNLTVFLQGNRFTFNGLEYLSHKAKLLDYNPQALLNIHTIGGSLSVSAGGTLTNNTYYWYKVGLNGRVAIKADSTFEPTESGQYYAAVTNSVVIGLTLKTDTVNYILSTVKNEGKIIVSPNPVENTLSIHGLDNKSSLKVTVTDMSGYVWLTTLSRQQSALKVDASRLKPGNYLVNISNGEEIKTVQFIKEQLVNNNQ